MKGSKAVWYRLVQPGISIVCAFLLILLPFGVPAYAQYDAPPQGAPPPQGAAPPPQPGQPQQAPAQLLTPEQLDNLVAPIALYPDPLLGQVLAASTYPLEIVEAEQFVQANRGMQSQQLIAAARQQNWDASVQALVVFPDVLGRMSQDVSWTTDLGNAFLAQQADVMNAVQRMRARAQAAGRLASDPEQTVTTQAQNGQTVIEIVPAQPNVIYVPEYNPAYIWGPPAWGYYPSLYYPAIGFGLGFGAGIFLGAFFGGWGGWGWGLGGWGWGFNWFGHGLLTNALFFNHYGFHGFYGGGFGRGGLWAHNPYHRLGVPYANRAVAGRFGGSYATRGGIVGGARGTAFGAGRFQGGTRFQGGARSFAPGNSGGWQHFGGTNAPRANGFAGSRYSGAPANRGTSGGGWNHFGAPNSSPANRGGFGGAASRPAPSFNGGAHSFGGGSFNGGARSFGGGGGARSFGGGGGSHSFGGGGSHSFGGGGGHSFGGGGGHSFGGGGGHSFGGGGGHSGGGGHGGGGGHHR